MTLGDHIVVMKDGIICQCAPPLVVYEQPVSRFVATFVGTPPMNFFEGRLQAVGLEPYFVFGPHKIKLSPRLAAAAHVGENLALGIRPECLSPDNSGQFAGEGNSMQLKVNLVEPLGEKVDLFLSAEGNDHIICRTEAHRFGRIPPGSVVQFYLNMERAHLFLPGEDGKSVSLGASAN